MDFRIARILYDLTFKYIRTPCMGRFRGHKLSANQSLCQTALAHASIAHKDNLGVDIVSAWLSHLAGHAGRAQVPDPQRLVV